MRKIVAVFLSVVATPLFSAELTIPHTFSAGTPAKASEVNANFNAVKSAVDAADSRLNTLENDNTDNKSDIAELQSTSTSNSAAITTLQTNMNGKQAILSNSCAVGSAIRAIDPNGNVTCESLVKSGKLTLQPTEFHPTSENFAVVGNCQALMGDSAFFGSGTSSSCAMLAAANFPHGATITSFQCFVYDNNIGAPAARIYADLARYSLNDTSSTGIATTAQSGTTNSYETISATDPLTNNVVDNNNYYYRVAVWFNAGSSALSTIGFGNLTLRNCTADYTMP